MHRLAVKSAKRIRVHLGGPTGIHGHAGIIRYVAIGGDPGLDVFGRKARVRVVLRARSNVDDAERRHQIFDRDFIDGIAVGRKMQGRVNVGAVVFIDRKLKHIEAVVGEVEQLLGLKTGNAEISREIRLRGCLPKASECWISPSLGKRPRRGRFEQAG